MQVSNTEVIHLSPETAYKASLEIQEKKVNDVFTKKSTNTLYFCEHSPIYTCGTSTNISVDYTGGNNIPVIKTGRGGRITYHGPGQRVIYPIIDLRERGRDLRKYINDLQKWLIKSLKEVGIEAHSDDDVGVWVTTQMGDKKIAAIGVRVRKWITFHGIALNVHPNMDHFKGIVPCGIVGKGVTSLKELGVDISMEEMDKVLLKNFQEIFVS